MKKLGWILLGILWICSFAYSLKTEPDFKPLLFIFGSILLLVSDLTIARLPKMNSKVGFGALALLLFVAGLAFVQISLAIAHSMIVGSVLGVSILTFFRIRDQLEKQTNSPS